MYSMSTLPPELEDLIIDHIRGDKKALASCGLISRSWLHTSRPHLFGSVTLRDRTDEDFLRLKASRHCTFIPSIRTLSISRPDKDTFSGTNFTELIPKLAGFLSLKCLRMFYVHWTDLSADSVTNFITVFHNITELEIKNTTLETPHHLIALLARLPRLEKVTVRTMFRTMATEMRKMPGLPMPPDPPRNLQVFQLREYDHTSLFGSILKWIAKGPTIHTLRLGWIWPNDLPDVGTHLRTLGPTLRDLHLDLVSSTSSRTVTENLGPHLACLEHVAHLTLRVRLSTKHRDASWALLAALPHEPAALETLTVFLEGDWMYLHNLDWEHFYATVHAHTRLRLLRFRVDSGIDTSWIVKEILKYVQPEFAARGSVEVDFLSPNEYE
ncbi:hypothetical protein GGX14DRAFT_694409 [Mycena pura]|uniref:F-box domain-containing protein n=1 Tax=Mycena pura TaxID=153505 RepID=A0AAD7E1G7_9AGAR|nr:hypothetical protein GGX14DRAFT_694409 [Mycena pura]